jgi:hypothetical protein
VLDDLVAEFGLSGVVNALPYIAAGGETLRWVVNIDGVERPDIDIRVVEDEAGNPVTILLVHGHQEVELWRWRRSMPKSAPASITRSLRELTT